MQKNAPGIFNQIGNIGNRPGKIASTDIKTAASRVANMPMRARESFFFNVIEFSFSSLYYLSIECQNLLSYASERRYPSEGSYAVRPARVGAISQQGNTRP